MSKIDTNLTSFIDIATDSDFSIHNLPYGIFSETTEGAGNNKRRAGVAIGEHVLDLAVLEAEGLLSLDNGKYFDQPTLNAFIDSRVETTGPKHVQQFKRYYQVITIPCVTIKTCRKSLV